MNICYINFFHTLVWKNSAIFIHIMHIIILYNSLHRNTKTYNIINIIINKKRPEIIN